MRQQNRLCIFLVDQGITWIATFQGLIFLQDTQFVWLIYSVPQTFPQTSADFRCLQDFSWNRLLCATNHYVCASQEPRRVIMGAEPAHVEAGRAAEAFAYLYMSRHLPKFGLNCWRSGARPHFHPEHGLEGVDDSLGYELLCTYCDRQRQGGLWLKLFLYFITICMQKVTSCSRQ